MDAVEVKVPLSLVLRAVDCCSAGLIDTDEPRKSKGKIFSWDGRAWTCVATCSQYNIWHWAKIIEVVPERLYKGRAHRRGERGYTGARFRCAGQVWVITDNKVTLAPNDEKPETATQISLFA